MRGSPHELNIPHQIRQELLDKNNVMFTPPPPAQLESVIRYPHQLLTESALLPFVQSYRSSTDGLKENGSSAGESRQDNGRSWDSQNNVTFSSETQYNTDSISLLVASSP